MTTALQLKSTPFPNMPTLRGGSAAAVCNGKIYVIGGGTDAYEFLNTVERFDPASGTWTSLPPMPTPRGNLVSAVIDTKIYTIGGLYRTCIEPPETQPSAIMEVFDTATNTWSRAADLPGGRVKPGVGAVGGKIYAVSGRDGDNNAKTVLCYDPATNQWTPVAQSPITVRHPAACVWNEKLYISGGGSYGELGKGKTKSQRLTAMLEFDPKTHRFTSLPDLKSERATHAMFVHQGRLFVLGGISTGKEFILDIDVLAPGGTQWETVGRLETPRGIFEAAVVGDVAYIMGGWTKLYKVANTTAVGLALDETA